MADSTLLIYGANGYTGELTARAAAQRGMTPILAGRKGAAIGALADELALPQRVFDLADAGAVDAALADVTAVLHCAGPFARTAKPMADGCLRNGVHYLDITGEIQVFEALAARHDEARAAGVMLLPGAGFDVVPTDCLAAHLARRLPSATRLTLAFQGLGGISRGTATTMIEQMGQGSGGMVRRNEVLTPVPSAWKTREVDFGRGPRMAMTIPWGDVSTAFHSTGIPNIEVYMAMHPRLIRGAKVSRYLGPLLAARPVQAFLKQRIRAGAPGPDAAARAAGVSLLWGMVEDDAGARAVSRMQTPEGYTLTVLASLDIAQKVLDGHAKPGYQTPSSAFGPDFILAIDGVVREDVE